MLTAETSVSAVRCCFILLPHWGKNQKIDYFQTLKHNSIKQTIYIFNKMDITKQEKLTKYEWESIERPVTEDEQEILNLISVGYKDVLQRYNHNLSLFVLQERNPGSFV